MCICIMCSHMCMYMFIEREKEIDRERERDNTTLCIYHTTMIVSTGYHYISYYHYRQLPSVYIILPMCISVLPSVTIGLVLLALAYHSHRWPTIVISSIIGLLLLLAYY